MILKNSQELPAEKKMDVAVLIIEWNYFCFSLISRILSD